MKNVKTKGVLDETGTKNFMITNTDTGEVHVAMRDGQKFTLGEFTGTLKQCKELVAEGKVVHFADAQPEPESNDSSWDCVHPCALLIRLCGMQLSHNNELRRTLDAFGWMKPDGTPDFEGADINYEKWSK